MDSVVQTLLLSSVPDTVKLTVLRNCSAFVEKTEFSEDLFKLADVISCFLSSDHEVPELLKGELYSIIIVIFSKASDDSLISLFRSLACSVPLSSLTIDKALLVALFTDCDRSTAFTDHIRNNQEMELNFLIVLLNALCVLCHSQFSMYLQSVALRSKHTMEVVLATLTENITGSQAISIIEAILHFMTQNTVSPVKNEDNYLESVIDLAFTGADLLMRFPLATSDNIPITCNTAHKSVSVAEFIYHKVETLLADPFNFNTSYLPLASLLFRLDSGNDILSVASFVESMVNHYAENPEAYLSILKRMTCWLVWPFRDKSSPLDKWIISFMCEVCRRTTSCTDVSEPVPEMWVRLMNDQLKVTIQLLVQQNTLSVSVLNTLAFLLLAGGRSTRAHRYQLFNEELSNALQHLIKKESGITSTSKVLFPRIARILQLAIVSMGTNQTAFKGCTLREIPNPAIQFFSQYEDCVTNETLIERAKVYEWPTLLRWGSRAGENLRRCWTRWERDAGEIKPQTTPMMEFERANPYRVTNHGGLLNVGNTCYANATLQLLYHCPDFRLAVLEHPIVKANSGFVRRSHRAGGSDSSYTSKPSSSTCSSLMEEPRGELLHMQLFSLFRALNTHVGPTVRDPGKVLTLSKPAHFVSGEQQDAVEYLIHLLQRLHDEEIELERGNGTSASKIDSSCDETDCFSNFSSSLSAPAMEDVALNASPVSAIRTSDNQTNESRTVEDKLSIVSRLFGGTLVRHTSCTECSHISSVLDEPFSCLYVPVSAPEESVSCTPNERTSAEVEATNRASNFDVDLTTLLRTHFSQIERVLSSQACEACGKRTVLARRLCLKSLASHVLICLKVFTFCRESQTSIKVMKKIAIPERLCVTLSSPDSDSAMESKLSQPFSTEAASPHPESPTTTDESRPRDLDVHEYTTAAPDSGSRSVTTRSFKLQGMILHHGLSIHCGHYTCVARVGMQWISFDDASVHLTSLDQIYATPLTTPYLLLYAQV